MTREGLETKLFDRPLSRLFARVAHSKRLSRALRLIERRHGERLTLTSASQHCGVEKNHLNHLLRSATGFTFHRLLIRFRLLKAVRLIRVSNINMLEVAMRSGFGSLSSLERNFSKLLDRTPIGFRRECRRW